MKRNLPRPAPERSAVARAEERPIQPSISSTALPPLAPTKLDRILHDRMRLAILTTLAVNGSLSFGELKAVTNASDGNLSVHARRLEERAYITCTKSFKGRLPRTHFEITPAGRKALRKYLEHLEAIIRHARENLS